MLHVLLILYDKTKYLWVINLEPAWCIPSSAQNFNVAPKMFGQFTHPWCEYHVFTMP